MAKHTFFYNDGQTCGNPARFVAGGRAAERGRTMIEKWGHFLAESDRICAGLMFVARAHDIMSGSIFYPPPLLDCDTAILFL